MNRGLYIALAILLGAALFFGPLVYAAVKGASEDEWAGEENGGDGS